MNDANRLSLQWNLAHSQRRLRTEYAAESDKTDQCGTFTGTNGALLFQRTDVDYFKAVNDSHGHQAGDEVLKGFARLLMGKARKDIDRVVRYGGEEFLIVLPETGVEDAMIFGEKMRVLIAANPFEIADATLSVSASFGVAGVDALQVRDEASIDRLIGHADACLYRSKEMGRNRVTGYALNPNDCASAA